MAKKYTIAPGHSVTDKDGNLVSSGTEVEASQLGDSATVERYASLGVFGEVTIEDARASAIVTGEGTDEAREKVQDDAEAAVKDAVKVERTDKTKRG
jgi:hypothetical protein